MNTAQFLAADPKVSAWVNASAGTGKTKVLTDRILNILLDGFAPERILCLTFTKAAAQEMSHRLMQKLARWATLPFSNLTQELEVLFSGKDVSPHQITRARQLFTMVLDAPGGIKIQTIHGFCQSILGRFPLEAKISPHFRILEEAEVEAFLREAQNSVFARPTSIVENALSILNPSMGDQRFSEILGEFYQYRGRIETLMEDHKSLWNYGEKLLSFLEVQTFVQNPEDILNLDLIPNLKKNFVPEDVDYDIYKNAFLTQKGEIRKKLSQEQTLQAEHVFRFNHSLSALEGAQRTIAFLILFQEIMEQYQDRKVRNGVLDYDDLIQKTQKLLTQPGYASWILYKLDGGIDHLLVDEAQDTNSAQWEIILKLTEDFFTDDKPYRTVFAVGDAKQSIYSFQGADPHEFLRLNAYFSELVTKSAQNWRDVELDLSYRSSEPVLTIVDEIFSKETNQRGMSFMGKKISHQVFREHDPGCVELWPLITPQKEEEQKKDLEWTLPVKRIEHVSSQTQLARYIAEQIKKWISSDIILPSTEQKIQPRDILILVRKRSSLVQEIIRTLKEEGIQVAGADRLILADHISVMDLLALGQFTLLPEDDYSLACVLRSPLIGLSEEELFTLSYNRSGTLWASLSQKKSENQSFEVAHTWLQACLNKADLLGVYEFYCWVLRQGEGLRRFLSRLGNEVEDVVDEFLTQALNYDQNYATALQGFIHFMQHQSQEIKRDASNTVHNQVRIMTVHGAKGLQAPIVILPDAAESGHKKADHLLWGEDLVMLWPAQAQDTDHTTQLKDKRQQAMAEEERRLLYVALTRAQDCLYVGGYTNGKEVSAECWYSLIQSAAQAKSATSSHQHGIFEKRTRPDEAIQKPPSLPEWISSRPKNKVIQRTLEKEEVSQTAAMDRGILIHKFFEYLPQLPEDKRYRAACQFIEKEGLSKNEWEHDIQEVLKILEGADFKDLFGENSVAEVPVVGFKDSKPFQARIDRVLITSDSLTIIDYKTDRTLPHSKQDVPEAYVKQLEVYEAALKSIYPHHKIKKMILWTAGPILQEL